ncbi:conjugal transfer protein TraB [Streptomyces sp. NPDC018019]|uniref:conjugal transfer protein TraB n=1 Tax=Streptomyces sp. NPDC018019 TaxID=3365030 RepID=UPI0037ACEE38
MSGDLVPRGDNLPAVAVNTDGLGFFTLMTEVAKLTSQALLLKEKVWAWQRRMEKDADAASHMSEMCDAAEVEPQYTARILDGAAALRRVADASGELAQKADDMQHDAQALGDAHQNEYGGINEVVQVMGVQQPKPGFNEVK